MFSVLDAIISLKKKKLKMHDNLSSHGSVFKFNTAYVDLDHCLSSQEEF